MVQTCYHILDAVGLYAVFNVTLFNKKFIISLAESGMGDSLDTVPIPSTSSADDLLHFHVENATVDGK